LWPDPATAQTGIRHGLAQANIVKLSDDELHFLTGSREPKAVRQLWHKGLRLVTLSMGSAGSVWFTATESGHVATFPVQAVDTTGAGDGFMAGLLAGILAAPDALADPPLLQRVCRFANAVGALTTLQRGAIPALPTRAAAENFLAGMEPS
jgi:fructokinase